MFALVWMGRWICPSWAEVKALFVFHDRWRISARFYFQFNVKNNYSSAQVAGVSEFGVMPCLLFVKHHQAKDEMCVVGPLNSSATCQADICSGKEAKNQETIFSSEILFLNDIQSLPAFDEQRNNPSREQLKVPGSVLSCRQLPAWLWERWGSSRSSRHHVMAGTRQERNAWGMAGSWSQQYRNVLGLE